jgi:hypothetical protein
MLPAMRQLCLACQVKKVSVLDVGPATCTGTALMHNALNHLLGVHVSFTGIDIVPDHQDFVVRHFPELRYIVGNIFKEVHVGEYDIVLCSHSLEHVENPLHFIARCNALARKFCLFYVPYAELNLIEGHLTSIDDAFLARVPSLMWSLVTRSVGWQPASDPDPRVLMFATSADGCTKAERWAASAALCAAFAPPNRSRSLFQSFCRRGSGLARVTKKLTASLSRANYSKSI